MNPSINKEEQFDVIGIGNALLDLIINVDEPFLEELGLIKGQMILIDNKKYQEISEKIAELPSKSASGGSAANTIKGVSSLGGKSAFIGMVGADTAGNKYIELVSESGATSKVCRGTSPTGVAITFITQDGERTFAAYLGAAAQLSENNIDEALIKNTKILHIEGYSLEPLNDKNASLKAMKIAKKQGIKISVDLSDPGLIARNLTTFKALLKEYIDIVFVNEHEAVAVTGKQEHDAIHELANYCEYAIVKLGSKGSIIKHKNTVHTIPIHKVTVVNTNGAGDAYAAGILYAIAHAVPMDKAGIIAALLSGKVVSIEEATINYSLRDDIKMIIER